MSTKRTLVTGASGFIGKHLVKRLVARGDNVTCLARRTSDVSALKKLRCSIAYADTAQDPQAVASAIDGCDTVYHLAASTRSVRSGDLVKINSSGMQNVLNGCAASQSPPTLIFVSSIAAVGLNSRSLPHQENNPWNPVSYYGRSKVACEKLAREYAAQVPISIVRPPIVLGQGDRQGLELFRVIDRFGWHFVPTFSTYDFSVIHVDDLATALMGVADRGRRLTPDPKTDDGIYFAAADETPTYSVLGRMVGRALGRKRTRVLRIAKPILWGIAVGNELKARLTATPQYLNLDKYYEGTAGSWSCSNQKIRSEVGFSLSYPLPERLEQTVNWYRQQGWLTEQQTQRSRDASGQVSGAR